jgi:asparagine synthase (glutamine-hydrolysing)
MCGIVGIFYCKKKSSPSKHDELGRLISRMCSAIRHRGPDDEGVWIHPKLPIGLGHRRLSILDLSSLGHQPMKSFDEKLWCTYNGEVYNYLELKDSLLKKGYKFHSATDTEVIINLYHALGEDFLDHLNGMFSLAIWDERKQHLFLARDLVGEKPLYYIMWNEVFYFSSEIRALLSVLPKESLLLSQESLEDYLSLGYASGENTIYKYVKKLLPGHYLTVSQEASIKNIQYWNPPHRVSRQEDLNQSIERLDDLLQRSIKMRLRSDVPIGIFLSGGIDSGLIMSYAAQQQSNISSFCVGVENEVMDERPAARNLASFFGTKHHEIVLNEDSTAQKLPEIFSRHDEPIADASIIPSYIVSQLASSQHIKVVLVGDGGDEIFGGYRRYLLANIKQKIMGYFPKPFLTSLCKVLYSTLPTYKSHRSSYDFFMRSLKALSYQGKDYFISQRGEGFTTGELCEVLKQPLYKETYVDKIISELTELPEVEKNTLFDFALELPSCLLIKMDIATMSHSVEARSPFLDKEIINFGLNLPTNLKVNKTQTKILLRALGERKISSEFAYRPKKGFEVPINKWLLTTLKPLTIDLLSRKKGLINHYFKKDCIENLIYNSFTRQDKASLKKIWILLCLGLWDYNNQNYLESI